MSRYQKMACDLVEKYGSANKAARVLGVHDTAVSLWIRGLRTPGTHNVSKMVAALDEDDWEERQKRIDSYAQQVSESGRIVTWIRGDI